MLKLFESNIAKKRLFTKSDKLLVAVSAGIDSTVLAHLLKKGKYNFGLAHFNFKLRGKESEADEMFCRELAKNLGVRVYIRSADTKKISEEKKKSIQMSARELRYQWFQEVRRKEGFDFIVTAHHLGDSVETFFINLLRGTGIKGLKGITEKKEGLVRPLLIFDKAQIESYASENKIRYRVDRSNLEDKYERNYLRLNVIPLLEELEPGFESTMQKNMKRLREEGEVIEDYFVSRRKKLFKKNKDGICALLQDLQKEAGLLSFLHFVLSKYGFNEAQCRDLEKIIRSGKKEGKIIGSEKYTIVTGKGKLCVVANAEKEEEKAIFSVDEWMAMKEFKFARKKNFSAPRTGQLLVNPARLVFPLKLRYLKTGDRFQPFGMKGSKLLSDFLKDGGLNRAERKKARVLENGNGEIIWVINMRSDERYRVSDEEKNLLLITYHG